VVALPDTPVKYISKCIPSDLRRSSARRHKDAALEDAAKLFTMADHLSGFEVTCIIIRLLNQRHDFQNEKLSTNVANKANE
jgi:hypothetical protein